MKHHVLLGPFGWSVWMVTAAGVASAQELYRTIDGTRYGDQLGTAVAGVPDLDGDAIPDIVVGGESGGPGAVGVVHAFSGATGQTIFKRYGEEVLGWGEHIGGAVAFCGDFNGDDRPDVAVGAVAAWGFSGEELAGRVAVLDAVSGTVLADVRGQEEFLDFGRDVAGIDDVNGDKLDDVIACGTDRYVRVLVGPDGTELRRHYDVSFYPSVDGLGDVDGDGHGDYVIGWPQYSGQAQYKGKVVVYSGWDGSELFTVHGVQGKSGSYWGDHLGITVAGVDDVDGDGVNDFAAGAPGDLWPNYQGGREGYVRVYSGADGALLHHVAGETNPGMLGAILEGGGDVNGDGAGDLLAGAPNEQLGGMIVGSVSVISGRTGARLFKARGELGVTAIPYYGVDVLGDLDGDGLRELAWCYLGADYSYFNSGRVWIYRGAPGDVESVCVSSTNSTGEEARIRASGTISVGAEHLTLHVEHAVPGQSAIFYYGSTLVQVPFGDGWRCAGGELYRIRPPIVLDASGAAALAVDFDSPPLDGGPGAWTPGSTWIVQCWYRDPFSGSAAFNLSDALRLQLTP